MTNPFAVLASRPRATAATFIVVLALAGAVVSGCGSKSDSGSSATPDNTSATTPPPAAPLADSTAIIGQQVFTQRCVLCHGPSGHGDGVGSKGLKPAPRNFHDAAYMSTRTDEQLSEVIHTGKGVMPKWGGILTDAQIHAVIAHIRTFAGTP